MVGPDPSLISSERSKKARASDEYQEKLVAQRQRLFAITFWIVVIMEAGLWYWGAPSWLTVVIPLFWIGFLIHNSALLVLHELWEINDQLAGRKDDFRILLTMERQGHDDEQSRS